ncbi:MAG TPA: class I SAM-dependent methyltransferase [Thermoanaerobaculia bacterium]|nr:class I SAM-dependent methyltransferase [Thermoanaerobaculia bacterium]
MSQLPTYQTPMLTPAEFWDREVTAPLAPPSHSWTAQPLVRTYINESVGGREGTWPLDWFQAAYPGRRFRRALSIGCGPGAFERDVVRRNLADFIEGADLSEKSLEMARDAAAAEGMQDRIAYSIRDFNTLELRPRTYDFIAFHQSLHHVARLEHLLAQVHRALTPDGLLYLDEFVGPSRTYWNEQRIRWYCALYQLYPRQQRYFDEFQLPVQLDDPSEAIRSGDIFSRVSLAFDFEHVRGYGGNILAVMFPGLLVETLTEEQIATMIAAEKALLDAGAPHFHAVITARPKRGWRGALAQLMYPLIAPFPRLVRELQFLVRRYIRRSRKLVAAAPES